MSKNTIADLVAAVQLRDVRLKESSAKTSVRDARDVKDAKASVSHGTKIMHRFDNGFIVGARLTTRLEPAESVAGSEAPMSIEVMLALTYSLQDAARFSDDVLEEFARVNGTFNAWPYWREYVQTTAARMSLPPLVLPVFRVTRSDTRVQGRPVIDTTARARPEKSVTRSGARTVSRKVK
jgi:hypothetical protein